MTEEDAIKLFNDQVITAIQGVTAPPVNLNPGAVTSVLMGVTVHVIMEARGLNRNDAIEDAIKFLKSSKVTEH